MPGKLGAVGQNQRGRLKSAEIRDKARFLERHFLCLACEQGTSTWPVGVLSSNLHRGHHWQIFLKAPLAAPVETLGAELSRVWGMKQFIRSVQSLTHPQKFTRVLKLTDGSLIRVSTLCAPPSNADFSLTQLNLDSANHPSWNPELRDRILLNDRGEVSKFRAKFEGDSFADFSLMAPEVGPVVAKSKKPPPPPKVAPKKKK